MFHGSIWEINLGGFTGSIPSGMELCAAWDLCNLVEGGKDGTRYSWPVAARNLHGRMGAFLARQHVDNML